MKTWGLQLIWWSTIVFIGCYLNHASSSLLSLTLWKTFRECNFNELRGGDTEASVKEDDDYNWDEEDEGDEIDHINEKSSLKDDRLKSRKGKAGATKSKGTSKRKKEKRNKADNQRSSSGSYRSKGNRKYNSYASKFTNGAVKLTKYSFKNMFDLVSPKNVNKRQIIGKWKMSQDVQLTPSAPVISCPATVELLGNGSVATSFDGNMYISEYKFTERSWPHYCKIQFTAHAFQGPKDKEPRKMLYKGYFKKSIMNSGLIMMRGKIYMLRGKLWKSSVKCGKFKATYKSRGSTRSSKGSQYR